jgi:hypothetical protein
MIISKYYNNTINWTFASKDKLKEISDNFNSNGYSITQGNAIVYLSNNEIVIDATLTLTNLISFFDSMKLHYNNGSGTRDIVMFIGADFVGNMQVKCKSRLLNNSTILVDPENPEIALSPQTSEDYCREIQSVDPAQAEHLLAP